MTAIRKVISLFAALGLLATSYAVTSAAGSPVTKTVGASITITGGQLTISTLGGTYGSPNNQGGTTSVNCGLTPTGPTPILSILYTTLVTNKQLVYFNCLQQYQVKDLRGTGNGWRLAFQASQWTCSTPYQNGGCTAGTTIALGSYYMDAPASVRCNTPEPCTRQGVPPAIKMTGITTIDTTTGVIVASAPANTGMGSYVFTPKTDMCDTTNDKCFDATGNASAGGQLGLYAPKSTKNGTYTSKLVESVIAGP